MAYTIDRTFENGTFNDIVERATKALSEEGFGVLSEIDVRATLKNKLDIDTPDYLICLLYTSPSPRDKRQSRMPSSA